VVASDPLREKLLIAEDRVAIVRAAVIFFNIAVYLLFLDPAVGIPWLAWTIIIVASLYAIGVLMLRPHRRAQIFLEGWFTTAGDSVLITAWIIGTGGIHSPFYLLWFVSLAAIAFRFGLRETFAAGGIYIGAYVGLVALMGQLPAHSVETLVRSVYIVFVTALAGLLAHESTRQWLSRAEIRRAAAGPGGDGVMRGVDMDRTLRSVLDSMGSFVRADRAAIYLLDEPAGRLNCAFSQGLSQQWIQARTKAYQELPGIAVLRGDDYLHVTDARTDPRLEPVRDAAIKEGLRSYAVFPLEVEGQRIGLISLYRDRVEPFSPQEIELARSLADRAAATIANARLVSELTESEARLQKVLASAPLVLFAADREGRITMLEGEGTTSLPMGRDEHIGRPVSELYPESTEVPHNIRRALDGEEFRSDVMIDGAVFAAHYAPVRDDEGKVEGVIGVAMDVTEQRRAEQEETERVKEQAELEHLREIDQFKTLFINTAAHELRTPLTPIKVQLHLLRTGGMERLGERQRNAVNVLERNIDRLGNLVEDILEGARIQAGRLRMEKKPISLDQVVAEAVESFVDPAGQAGILLVSRVESGLVVPADPKRIIQVLFNLLSNALKFTPKGGQIIVETKRVGDMGQVIVRDTGAGLSREQAARLFRPFSQVHDPMATVRGGTGLGLYISRSLVDLHGGRIWCESPGPGQGSTFTFTLPLKEVDQQTEVTDWGMVASRQAEETKAREILSPAEKDRLARRARELV
jgi:PAS domain S-box-containing protein